MNFKLEFNCDNDAFQNDGEDDFNIVARNLETTRILNKIISDINRGVEGATIRDINGNKVGQWSF